MPKKTLRNMIDTNGNVTSLTNMRGKKLSQRLVEEFFVNHGCRLLDVYEKAHVPMKYICRCGCEGKTCWSEFRRGNRCGWCGKRQKKFTDGEIVQELQKAGCELLSPYQGIRDTLHFKCKCGREHTTTLESFKRNKKRCYDCWVESISSSNSRNWNPDRERIAANKKYRMACTNLVHRCLQVMGKRKHQRSKELLGYTPVELKSHLATHPNYQRLKDKKWHIDHIFPIAAFVDYGVTNLKLINCLENLQPMLGADNVRKHNKYDKAAFAAWLETHGVK